MGKVLVEASKVKCGAAAPHLGSIAMSGAARLVVDGSKVLTKVSVLGPARETPFPGCNNPNNTGGPCAKIASMSDGAATRLKVDGEFVVLDSLKASTNNASDVMVDSTLINNNLLEAD